MITQMEVLFLIMAIGYIASKLGVITETVSHCISKMFTTVILPFMMFDSMLNGDVTVTGQEAFYFLFLVLIAFVILLAVALPVKQMMRDTPENSGIYRFMVAFTNVGFVGYPVANAIYGTASYLYLALYCIGLNIFMFSVGIMFVSVGQGKVQIKRILLNRILLITVSAFILFLLGVRLPSPLAETCTIMTKIGVPAGVLVVGSSLGRIPFKEVFNQWKLYPVIFIRLIVAPLMTWFVLHLFVHDDMMLGILTICAALPTAAFCSMLSIEYGSDEILASKGVFLTTLFSMVTIPLLVFLLF